MRKRAAAAARLSPLLQEVQKQLPLTLPASRRLWCFHNSGRFSFVFLHVCLEHIHTFGVFWPDFSRSVHVEPLIPKNPGFLSSGADFNLTEVDLSWNEGVKTAQKLLPATLACC